jgi:hypothetical protein
VKVFFSIKFLFKKIDKQVIGEKEGKKRWHEFSLNLKTTVDFDILVDPLWKRIQSDSVDIKRFFF